MKKNKKWFNKRAKIVIRHPDLRLLNIVDNQQSAGFADMFKKW